VNTVKTVDKTFCFCHALKEETIIEGTPQLYVKNHAKIDQKNNRVHFFYQCKASVTKMAHPRHKNNLKIPCYFGLFTF
jgi:hypothetical protein